MRKISLHSFSSRLTKKVLVGVPGVARIQSLTHKVIAKARTHVLIAGVAGSLLLASIGAGSSYLISGRQTVNPVKAGTIAAGTHEKAEAVTTVGQQASNTVTGESKPGSTAGHSQNAKPGTTTTKTTSQSTTQLAGYSSTQSGLVLSPSKAVIPAMDAYMTVAISNNTGTAMRRPTVSSVNGLHVYIQEPAYIPSTGGVVTQKTWFLSINRIDYSTGGSEYATITSLGQSTKLLIIWNPAPRFDLVKGGMTRTDNGDTITHTATFSITPNNPYFGTPTMYMRLGGFDRCLNTGDLARSFVYNGQNTFSFNCVVRRIPPYVPNTGMDIPPLPSGASFYIDVYGMVGSEFVRGPSPITYILYPGYDR